jgi:hypothetical protein
MTDVGQYALGVIRTTALLDELVSQAAMLGMIAALLPGLSTNPFKAESAQCMHDAWQAGYAKGKADAAKAI